jgi:hypothetical protein
MGSSFGKTLGLGGPSLDGPSDKFTAAFGDMLTRAGDTAPGRVDPLKPFLPGAPRRNKGGAGDVLATILAVAADATDPEGRNIATSRLANSWAQRGNAYDQAMQTYQDRQRMANLPGMTPREMAAYVADPKAWGSHMSDAATSRYQAATLNPGDQRFLGEGNGVYQAPTRGQLYAQSLGLPEGSDEWTAAIKDQELASQGPTAFANDVELEGVRQQGRVGLEGVRQRNRMGLEGVRQTNRVGLKRIPAPPRVGARENFPTVKTPAEAMTLPPGTKFKTPDGRIKIR